MVARVGIFDSGVGGLSVTAALHRLQPSIDIRYLADTAFFPWGDRSEAEVSERVQVMAGILMRDDVDAIVIACNTATSAGVERLRATLTLPVVGMEPPLKPAVEASTAHVVAVLVTPGTAKGERLARLHERFAEGARVFTLPMPGLADLVESGEVDGPRVEAMLSAALEEPVREGIDALALGCTHYAFLRPVLSRMLPARVRIIDASAPVARRVVDVLTAAGIDLGGGEEQGEVLCYATGDPSDLEAKINRLRAAGADLPPLRVARPVG